MNNATHLKSSFLGPSDTKRSNSGEKLPPFRDPPMRPDTADGRQRSVASFPSPDFPFIGAASEKDAMHTRTCVRSNIPKRGEARKGGI